MVLLAPWPPVAHGADDPSSGATMVAEPCSPVVLGGLGSHSARLQAVLLWVSPYSGLLISPNCLSQQSGGVSIPPMKMVNPASRLKQSQQGSPDKSKHIKQRMEYMRIQGQQQVAYL